jgi:outer membrane lipoprotein-sorting protein
LRVGAVIAVMGLGASGVVAQPQPKEPAPAVAAQPADDAFNKRLEAVDAAMGKVTDLRADFEQRRHTALLKKPLVSKGVVLTKGDKVRWDTATPRASSMVISPSEIKLYYPADKLVEVYPVGEGFKDLAGAPLPRLSVLRARFEIAPLGVKELGGDEGDKNLVAVVLTPKSEEMRKHVVSVKVLIDSSKPAATKVVMSDSEGEETEILFSSVKLNSGVKDDELVLKLPEGVRVSKPLGEGKGAKKNEGAAKDDQEKKP